MAFRKVHMIEIKEILLRIINKDSIRKIMYFWIKRTVFILSRPECRARMESAGFSFSLVDFGQFRQYHKFYRRISMIHQRRVLWT